MRKPFYLLLAVILLITSCEKEKFINTATSLSNEVIAGRVESISPITNHAGGFGMLIIAPDDRNYHATFNDSFDSSGFEIGNSVLLKGELVDHEFLTVEKVLSVDNDHFTIRGMISRIEGNKGGFEADIMGVDGETYVLMMSVSNLGNDYQDFHIGEDREVRGQLWKGENQLHITVKNVLQ